MPLERGGVADPDRQRTSRVHVLLLRHRQDPTALHYEPIELRRMPNDDQADAAPFRHPPASLPADPRADRPLLTPYWRELAAEWLVPIAHWVPPDTPSARPNTVLAPARCDIGRSRCAIGICRCAAGRCRYAVGSSRCSVGQHDFAAMFDDPKAKVHMERVKSLALTVTPAFYVVAYVGARA